MALEQDVQQLIKQHRNYALVSFAPILEEILGHFGSLKNLAGKDVLELGPGTRVDLMRFLLDRVKLGSIAAAGRSAPRPWARQRDFIGEHVRNVHLLDFFSGSLEPRYDLIYSRFVFEQHSIDPWILLGSRSYWGQFKKRDFKDFDEAYPASIPNLQAVFRKAWCTLRPEGVLISCLGKRQYTVLDRGFLETFNPQSIIIRDMGRLSQIVTVVK